MAVIDGVFCLDTRDICRRETLSVVMLKWREIVGTYNTPNTIVRDEDKVVIHSVQSNVSITARALYKLAGAGYKKMEKRLVFRRDSKTDTDGVKVTCSGRLFQTRALATRKDRSPAV